MKKFLLQTGFLATVGITLVMIVTSPFLSSPAVTLKTTNSTNSSGRSICLDLQPFEDPTAIYLCIHGTGEGTVVRYRPNQFVVLGVFHGALPRASISDLFRTMTDSSFQEAMRRGGFGGEGLTRGDQFRLSIRGTDGRSEEATGFLLETPNILQDFIRKLVAACQSLPEFSSSPQAFLRGTLISSGRLERIRRKGVVALRQIDAFPANLQEQLKNASRHLDWFLPLSLSDHQALITVGQGAPELYVLIEKTGFQISLYKRTPR